MIEGRSDLWHVQLASGDLEVMTLDELDEAFNSDRIDESTMVLQGGALKWARLGEILGLDEEEAPPVNRLPTPFLERPSEELMTPSVRPLAYDVGASSGALSLQGGDDDFDPDLALLNQGLRPSKKRFLVLGIAAGLLLAVGGVGLSKIAGSAAVDASATNANISTAVVAAAAPQPAAHATDDSVSADSLPGSRLSADQKKMLAGMDKKLEDAQKVKAEAAAERAAKRVTHGKYKKGKSGLKEGGDPHDPLNASLHKTTGKW